MWSTMPERFTIWLFSGKNLLTPALEGLAVTFLLYHHPAQQRLIPGNSAISAFGAKCVPSRKATQHNCSRVQSVVKPDRASRGARLGLWRGCRSTERALL